MVPRRGAFRANKREVVWAVPAPLSIAVAAEGEKGGRGERVIATPAILSVANRIKSEANKARRGGGSWGEP